MRSRHQRRPMTLGAPVTAAKSPTRSTGQVTRHGRPGHRRHGDGAARETCSARVLPVTHDGLRRSNAPRPRAIIAPLTFSRYVAFIVSGEKVMQRSIIMGECITVRYNFPAGYGESRRRDSFRRRGQSAAGQRHRATRTLAVAAPVRVYYRAVNAGQRRHSAGARRPAAPGQPFDPGDPGAAGS